MLKLEIYSGHYGVYCSLLYQDDILSIIVLVYADLISAWSQLVRFSEGVPLVNCFVFQIIYKSGRFKVRTWLLCFLGLQLPVICRSDNKVML